MTTINENSSDYKIGYKAGYIQGKRDAIAKRKNFPNEYPRAYWIMRKGDWYCSCCDTKNEQKYENFCCKCGCKMSLEAGCEDN